MLTLIINYDTVKYMKKIQTWLSDLSDWFYNLKNINQIAFTVNVIDAIQDDMLDNLNVVPDQIEELYNRVRVLEIAESNRQFEALILATEESMKKSKKSTKKSTVKKSSKK